MSRVGKIDDVAVLPDVRDLVHYLAISGATLILVSPMRELAKAVGYCLVNPSTGN